MGKYVFFDFENKWQQRVSDENIEMDPTQIENELVVTQSLSYMPYTAIGGVQTAYPVPMAGTGGGVGPASAGTTAAARGSQQQIQ